MTWTKEDHVHAQEQRAGATIEPSPCTCDFHLGFADQREVWCKENPRNADRFIVSTPKGCEAARRRR